MAFNLKGVLSLDSSGFTGGLKKAESAASGFGGKIKGATSQVGGLVKTAAKVAGGLGIAKMAKDSIMLASDLTEVQNVVDTTFGESAGAINEFANSAATNFGMSALEAKKFNGTIGAMLKSSGIGGDELTKMSTGLIGLSGDMASFYNLQPEEAFNKLKSAISGETEPMKALGVDMSVTNLEAYALKKGVNKAWKELTQAEKATLRYQYVMEATADAQGDFTKTNKTFANQLKVATLNLKTLGSNIGSMLIPVLNKVVLKFNDFISSIDVTKIQTFITSIGQQLLPSLTALKDFIMIEVVPRFQALGTKMYELYTTFAPTLGSAFDTLKGVAADLVTTGLDLVKGAFQWLIDHKERVEGVLGDIQTAFQVLSNVLSGDFSAAWANLQTLTGNVLQNIKDISTALVSSDSPVIRSIGQGLEASNPIFTATRDWKKNMEIANKTADRNKSNFDKFRKDPSLNTFGGWFLGKNANGTSYFRGGASMVNERGGEMQILPNGTSVIPADRTKEMVSNTNNNTRQNININIDARGMDVDTLVTQLKLRLSNL